MARLEMEVTIDEEGNVTLEAHGIKGRSCLSLLGELAKALGKASDPKPTAEMYQVQAAETTRQKGK